MITQDLTIQYNPQWRNTVLQKNYLEVDTSINAQQIIITLPEIASMGGFYNVEFYITDKGGAADTYPIIVQTQGSDTIDSGNIIKAITVNYGSAMIVCTSNNTWMCLESSVPNSLQPASYYLANGLIDFGNSSPQPISILGNFSRCVITDILITDTFGGAVTNTTNGTVEDSLAVTFANLVFNNSPSTALTTSNNFINKDVDVNGTPAVKLYGASLQDLTFPPFNFICDGLDTGVYASIYIYGYTI
jgi:hypothetical protein